MQTDAVLYWNDVALEANLVSHTDGGNARAAGPVLSARALAIVHLAMYDALAGVRGDPASLPAYLPGLPVPAAGASEVAAIAGAAHATLSALHPSQKSTFNSRLADLNLSGPGASFGLAFGKEVAKAILADRQNDGNNSDAGYTLPTGRFQHQRDPDYVPTDNSAVQPILAPFYGANTKCFAVANRPGLRLDPPPRGNQSYLKALREVRTKGIAPDRFITPPAGVSSRTAEETLIGVFWGYDGTPGLGTPPRLYNQIIRQVAAAHNPPLDLADNARLFALVNAAMADAGILAWEEKYRHNLWRPVVAIQNHDLSMGSMGQRAYHLDMDCDPLWLPLGAPSSNSLGKNFTPPFPAYPSGHATFGAAALHMAQLFFKVPSGNKANDLLAMNLGFVSDELNGITKDNRGMVRPRHVREFPDGLWEMIEENGRSRVYLGIHWIFDAFAEDQNGEMDLTQNIGGVRLGVDIAEDIFNATGTRTPKKATA